MVEMMIAVAITAVCMVMTLRVFSICAIAVSGMYNSTHSVNIFQEKMDEFQLNAILDGGVEIAFAETDYVEVEPGRKFEFKIDAVPWLSPISLVTDGEVFEAEDSNRDKEIDTGLSVVQAEVIWEHYGKEKSMKLETIFPTRQAEQIPSS